MGNALLRSCHFVAQAIRFLARRQKFGLSRSASLQGNLDCLHLRFRLAQADAGKTQQSLVTPEFEPSQCGIAADRSLGKSMLRTQPRCLALVQLAAQLALLRARKFLHQADLHLGIGVAGEGIGIAGVDRQIGDAGQQLRIGQLPRHDGGLVRGQGLRLQGLQQRLAGDGKVRRLSQFQCDVLIIRLRLDGERYMQQRQRQRQGTAQLPRGRAARYGNHGCSPRSGRTAA